MILSIILVASCIVIPALTRPQGDRDIKQNGYDTPGYLLSAIEGPNLDHSFQTETSDGAYKANSGLSADHKVKRWVRVDAAVAKNGIRNVYTGTRNAITKTRRNGPAENRSKRWVRVVGKVAKNGIRKVYTGTKNAMKKTWRGTMTFFDKTDPYTIPLYLGLYPHEIDEDKDFPDPDDEPSP